MFRENFLYGLNAGGSEHIDSSGNVYEADTFGVGRRFSTGTPIEGTVEDSLYQSETWRQNSFEYLITIEPGQYYVELNLAEIYYTTEMARVFDVYIEDQLVADDLDVVSLAGRAFTAHTVGYFVDVTDGALNLKFDSQVENAKINAFSIWSVSQDEADSTAPSAVIDVSGGATASDPVTVEVTYSDDVALDPGTLDIADLAVSGPGDYTIVSQDLVVGADGRTATATYVVTQDGGWTSDPVAFDVATGAVSDTSGNPNQGTAASFSFGAGDTLAPAATISVSAGGERTDPIAVTVTYTDDSALDVTTLDLSDLTILGGAQSYTIVPLDLVVAGDEASATATYEVSQTGGWTDETVTFELAADAFADMSGNTNVATSVPFNFLEPFAGIAPTDTYADGAVGSARITVTAGQEIEASTYDADSFVIQNDGDKRIAAVYFDLSTAMLTDAVFDPVGEAGDDVARGLTFGSTGNTGAIVPADVLEPFFGSGGALGYEGMVVTFDPDSNGGFEGAEIATFGVDIDGASIRGIPKTPIDINGDDPRLSGWDIGGVSGLELMGAEVTVLFADGSTAKGELFGDGTDAGAVAVADQGSPALDAVLAVNGISEGQSGNWGQSNSVVVDGPAGETLRVVMVTGFAQPFDYTAPDGTFVSAAERLIASGDPFGANNALEVQVVDVVLAGGPQDITGLFDFAPPGGALSFANDDQVPISFASAIIDETGAPLGDVTNPIYLAAETDPPQDATAPTVAIALGDVGGASEPLSVTVTYSDETGLDPATVSLSDLSVTTDGPVPDILSSDLVFSADGLSATANYDLLPAGGWTGAPVDLAIAAGAFADLAGNQAPGASETFVFGPPPDTTAPDVAISLGTVGDASTPLSVVVSYSDDTGLDYGTISLDDLAIASTGPAVDILSSDLAFAQDGLSAVATYTVLPSGGWTTDGVDFTVAAGAIADGSGNVNAAETDSFAFVGDPSTVVDALADLTQLTLQGINDLRNPTTLEVGEDGRLYVSQQNGRIFALDIENTVTRDANGLQISTWSATDIEIIDLIRDMPNHNDQGIYEPGTIQRVVTGLTTTTDADGNMVIYVSSTDPRTGGGASVDDTNLDTNSGILSRLTQVDDGNGNLVWEKLDLVRGLPRSEELHATNGLILTQDENGDDIILLTVGGFTNQGAQSNNFAFTSEYYYAASVVKIDLKQLNALEAAGVVKTYTPPGSADSHQYLFDLPTLDDITRENDPVTGLDLAGDGSTTADVFGGNEGLNQAIFDPQGIVEVVYTGLRNAYDIVLTDDGKLYTVDNGSNAGWGGPLLNAQGEVIVDADGDGLPDNGPAIDLANDVSADNADSLLLLDDDIFTPDATTFYGGHPNIVRASGPDGGLYLYANQDNQWGVAPGTPLDFDPATSELVPTTDPVDLGPLIPNFNSITGLDDNGDPIVDPQQAVFLGTGTRTEGLTSAPNDAIYTFFSSTNGIDIIKSAGALNGALVTVSLNGNIYALTVDDNGNLLDVEKRALTSQPLDVETQGADDPYPNVIFVASYGADQITILSPDVSVGVTPDPDDRDEDGIQDTIDPFAADPDNGLADTIAPDETLYWSFAPGDPYPNDRDALFDGTGGLYNGGDIGFTGIMTNRGGLPESLYVQDNIIFGGAPGVLQIKSVDSGDATTDTQRSGFQFGTAIGDGLEFFTVDVGIDNFLDEIWSLAADEKLAQGIFIGAGDQDNFVSLSLVRLSDGRVGFEVVSQFAFDFVGATAPQTVFYEVPDVASATTLDLGFEVDVATATLVPTWTYNLVDGSVSGSGAGVALQGDALSALEGTLTLPDTTGGQVSTGLAIGVAASRGLTSGLAGETVAAFSAGGDETFSATIDGNPVVFTPDTQTANVTLVGSSKVFQASEALDLSNTTLDELHTEERYANNGQEWGYSVDTGNGEFVVDLYLAEIWSGAFSPGIRVFDVFVEGQLIADNFDIFVDAGGGNLETILQTTATVFDGTLDITFVSEVENAKVDAVHIREVGTSGTFVADYDDIEIEGFGTAPDDTVAPSVSVGVVGGIVKDDPVTVTVDYTDNVGLDPSTLELSDLVVSGTGTYTVTSSDLTVGSDGRSATATYTIIQDTGWTTDPVDFTIADAAIADTSGNPNAAASGSFVYEEVDTTTPSVSISATGPTAPDEPLSVVVSFSDETGLDPSTLELSDLVISGAGTYTVTSQDLAVAADGLTATATYAITQNGGWSTDEVTLGIPTGAIADTSGNINPSATESFVFQPSDVGNPTASIAISGGAVAENPVSVTVTYADDFGLDPETLDLADLTITGSGSYVINDEALVVAPDGQCATATYSVTQTGGWTTDPVLFDIAAGAFADSSGNLNGATSETFTFDTTDTVDPSVAITVSSVSQADEPLSVVVTYSDNTGLDVATLDLADLSISGAGIYSVDTQELLVTPDGLSAVASYTIFQDGGWTSDPLSLEVGSGAVADVAGNPNAAAADQFIFDEGNTHRTLVTALNAGGNEYTDSRGIVFAADTLGIGRKYTVSKEILGTEDDPLYQTETWQPKGFTYDVAVPDGTYEVELHFAEIYFDSPSDRVFDVQLEGGAAFDDLDIVAQTEAADTALVLNAVVEVTDGSLTIGLSPVIENPKLSAFAIWEFSDDVGV